MICKYVIACNNIKLPASVAQLDARPTGDRRSRVRPPPRSATFFRGD